MHWTPKQRATLRCQCLAFLALACGASAGTVETLDGRASQGDLRLDADAIVVTSSNLAPERIALSNLLRADFTAATNPPSPPSARLAPLALDDARGALPDPWHNLDVGRLARPGSAIHSRGTFTLEAARSADKERDDGYHLVCQSFRGDGEIIARVASLDPRDDKDKQARAGVVLRAGLTPEDRTVLMSLTGGGGFFFRRWAGRGGGASEARRPDLKPPYWVKLAREGKRVTASHSTDGRRWIVLEAPDEPMPDRIYMGLAVMSRRRDSLATASFDHVTVRPITPRPPFTPRLVLKDGTVIADYFTALGDTMVAFSPAHAGRRVLTMHVARVLFQSLDDPDALPPHRTGVLLSNGDFVDCEIASMKNNRVTVTSVLFGQRHYDLGKRIAALALRSVTTQPASFELKTVDGSVLRCQSLRVGADEALVETPLAGAWRVSRVEIQEIVRTTGR